MRERGQVSLTVVEAGVGVLFIVAVSTAFAFGTPGMTSSRAQLEAYASDTATVLASESPRHGGATRLVEIVASNKTFNREKEELERRIDRILPDNLMFQVSTRYGNVGYTKPSTVPVGVARIPTRNGPVIICVWYA